MTRAPAGCREGRSVLRCTAAGSGSTPAPKRRAWSGNSPPTEPPRRFHPEKRALAAPRHSAAARCGHLGRAAATRSLREPGLAPAQPQRRQEKPFASWRFFPVRAARIGRAGFIGPFGLIVLHRSVGQPVDEDLHRVINRYAHDAGLLIHPAVVFQRLQFLSWRLTCLQILQSFKSLLLGRVLWFSHY